MEGRDTCTPLHLRKEGVSESKRDSPLHSHFLFVIFENSEMQTRSRTNAFHFPEASLLCCGHYSVCSDEDTGRDNTHIQMDQA